MNNSKSSNDWRRGVLTALIATTLGGISARASATPPLLPPPRPPRPAEPPSTVNATYVDPSAETPLKVGEKLGRLYARNDSQPYVLQRLTTRSYWVQRQHYAALFYVGDKGVLLFDAPEGAADAILKAIAVVTKLPITALVYSHDHADHIGDAHVLIDAAAKAKTKLRVIASKATAEKMVLLKSGHPKPTETVAWPRGSFTFEGLTVELHGFTHAAHADDHGAWLLRGQKVVHLPDLVNPDQPPFWAWAGSQTFVYYQSNLDDLAKLDWAFLSGGHGNIGSRADIDFYRTFIADMKAAVGKALGEVKFGDGVDIDKANAHTVFLTTFLSNVAKAATESLRPKYGMYYGYDYATPRNAEMVALSMFSYR